MTKDRFQDLRKAAIGSDDTIDSTTRQPIDDSAIELEDVTLGEDGGYMEEFFEQVGAIRKLISNIEQNVASVIYKHSAILASPENDERTKEELEQLMTEIKTLGNKVRGGIKAIEGTTEKMETDGLATSASVRIRSSQLTTISRKFMEVMAQYNKAQVDYREACKSRIRRQMEIASRDIGDQELEDMLDSGNAAVFTQGIMTDTQQAKRSLADIQARHEDIVKLEKSLKELHDMFLDMAVMVQAQGDLVDRIEHNVQQSVDYVDTARNETNTAVSYQGKARRTKICLIASGIALLIAIGIAVLVAILVNQ